MTLKQEDIPFFSLFIPYLFLTTTGMLLLLLRRHKEPLKSRGIPLLLLQTLSGLCVNTLNALGPFQIGCFLYLLRSPLLIFWVFPYVFRGIVLYLHHIRQSALEQLRVTRRRSSSLREQKIPEVFDTDGTDFEMTNRPAPGPSRVPSQDVAAPSENPPRLLKSWEIQLAAWVQRNKWVFTWKYDLLIFGTIFVLFGLIAILRYFLEPFKFSKEERADPDFEGSDRCDQKRTVLAMVVNALIIVISVGIVAVFLWSARDAYHLKHELVAVFVISVFLVPTWLISTFDILPVYVDRFFWIVTTSLFFVLVSLWMPIFASFTYEKRLNLGNRRQSGAQFYGPEAIYTVFNNPTLKKNFAEYLFYFPSSFLFELSHGI